MDEFLDGLRALRAHIRIGLRAILFALAERIGRRR
jgi:hypothetical protein